MGKFKIALVFGFLVQLLAGLTPSSGQTQSHVCTTFVGNYGTTNFGVRDGTNNEARFSMPCGIARDPDGTLYVADTYNNLIRKITRLGSDFVVTTIAGKTNSGTTSNYADGTNTAATFWYPQGMTMDTNGNLFVADSGSIRKMSRVGTNWVTTTLAYGFGNAVAVALDGAGGMYVADSGNHTIDHATMVGARWTRTTIAGLAQTLGSADGTNSEARFFWPNCVVLGKTGDLFVADYWNNTIRQLRHIGPDWVVTTIAGVASPQGAVVDGTNSAARFNGPLGITIDNSGTLYVSECGGIRKMTCCGSDWGVTTILGYEARFFEPNAILVDNSGALYVTDTRNNVLRAVEPIPSIQARSLTRQLVLMWPISVATYGLQSCPDLGNPDWTPVTGPVTAAGSALFWTNELSLDSRFFRLSKQ